MMQEDENEEAADDDPGMEGELTSADYRKLQSLVDEQEKAVEAGGWHLCTFIKQFVLRFCWLTCISYADLDGLQRCVDST